MSLPPIKEGDSLTVVAQQIEGDDGWRNVHVRTFRERAAADRYIAEQDALDTTMGGLIAPSKLKIRYEVRTCIVERVERIPSRRPQRR
jgi:hypothetical protein